MNTELLIAEVSSSEGNYENSDSGDESCNESEDDISDGEKEAKLKRIEQKKIHSHIVKSYYSNTKVNNNKKRRLTKNKYEKCAICLSFIRKMTFLPCCHFFHEECIDKWNTTNIICPECRIPIFIQDYEQLEDYNQYKIEQIEDTDSFRNNLPIDDNTLAFRYVKDTKLFPAERIEVCNIQPIQKIREMDDLNFIERYEGLLSDEDENRIDALAELIREDPEQARLLRIENEINALNHYSRLHRIVAIVNQL